jgi:pyruvate,orthophosphate dikinase
VIDFLEGNKDLKDLLGGKGANLAEMKRIGLPVPPGFTISTEACRDCLRSGAMPPGLLGEVEEQLLEMESRMATAR